MHEVELVAEVGGSLADALREDALRLLGALDLEEDAELSVLLVDDARVRELNASWRGKDAPTDVLSFPQQDGEVVGGVLGDVVISVDTAARQAAEHGHTLAWELRVLLVHGLCHLLGHTHDAPAATASMQARERDLLGLLSGHGEPVGAGLVERATREG